MKDIEKLVQVLKNMPKIEQADDRRRVRIIARALDKKGRIICTKTNQYTISHPIQKHYAVLAGRPEAIFLHAEIATLVAAQSYNKEVHTLLIARIDANGIPVLSAPCDICTLAIKKYGVKEIIHT